MAKMQDEETPENLVAVATKETKIAEEEGKGQPDRKRCRSAPIQVDLDNCLSAKFSSKYDESHREIAREVIEPYETFQPVVCCRHSFLHIVQA